MSVMEYRVVGLIKNLKDTFAAFESAYKKIGPDAHWHLDGITDRFNVMDKYLPEISLNLFDAPDSMECLKKMPGMFRYEIFQAEVALSASDPLAAEHLNAHSANCIQAIESKNWDTVKAYLDIGFSPVMIAEHVLMPDHKASVAVYDTLVSRYIELLKETGHLNPLCDILADMTLGDGATDTLNKAISRIKKPN